MDQGEDDARSVIRDAFDIALETDMAVALHLDDYMFWAQARLPGGRLLRGTEGTTEWKDWSGTPAEGSRSAGCRTSNCPRKCATNARR
jgi:hypothetical protein